VSLRGGWLEGGPAGNCQPDGAPRPFALARILKTRLQGQPPISRGSKGTARDNRFRTRRKGAAFAAPLLAARSPSGR